MSGISLDDVRKVYRDGRIVAVDGVSIDVSDGEFVSLVGPSGCGKTTTLRMIAGFEQPTAGTVNIGDRDVTHDPPYTRNTGMVFQDFALFPHMTVEENVAYGLHLHDDYSGSRIDDRVTEMLELVQLPEMRDRMPEQLSGGQQQRIALARALAPAPEVLLLDEPLASLDKKLREQMQIELQRIQREVNITTVFVTHNQEEALSLSDRVAVMNGGAFEQVGTPSDVYDSPQSRFVADFIGTSNIFEGTVRRTNGRTVTVDCGDVVLSVRKGEYEPPEDSDIYVVVRPESVQTRGGRNSSSNELTGVVESRRHLGSVMEYHILTERDRRLIAVNQRTSDEFEIGTELTVGIDPTDCLLLDQ